MRPGTPLLTGTPRQKAAPQLSLLLCRWAWYSLGSRGGGGGEWGALIGEALTHSPAPLRKDSQVARCRTLEVWCWGL